MGRWYIVKRDSHLYHSAKGSTWKKHKYIKKIKDRYFYTMEELRKAGQNFKEYVGDMVIAGEYETVGNGTVVKDTRVRAKDALKTIKDKIGNMVVYSERKTVGNGTVDKDVTVRLKDTSVAKALQKGTKSVKSAIKKVGDIELASTTTKQYNGITVHKATTVSSLANKGMSAIKRIVGIKPPTRRSTNKSSSRR